MKLQLCIGVIGLVFAACSAKEPRTHHVDIRGMQFVPADLAVTVGDTVVWTNSDIVPHTVTSTDPSPATFDSQQLTSKQTWQYKVTAAGEYSYVCTFHPTMRAKLTATAP